MSNDSLLIVSYISVLVLNFTQSDAIRAIEIVLSSEPNDPLLKANLHKLNAVALMKAEAKQYLANPNVNQAYRELQAALKLFEQVGHKSNCDNETNLGRALCLYGMSRVMFKNQSYFEKQGDEDYCLKQVVNLLEQAIEIYRKRDHRGGIFYCLKHLIFAKRKLKENYLYLQTESKNLRQLHSRLEKGDPNARVPDVLI